MEKLVFSAHYADRFSQFFVAVSRHILAHSNLRIRTRFWPNRPTKLFVWLTIPYRSGNRDFVCVTRSGSHTKYSRASVHGRSGGSRVCWRPHYLIPFLGSNGVVIYFFNLGSTQQQLQFNWSEISSHPNHFWSPIARRSGGLPN